MISYVFSEGVPFNWISPQNSLENRKYPPGLRTIIEHLFNNLNASRTSSERIMFVKFMSCVQEGYIYLMKVHVKRHPSNYMFRVNNKTLKQDVKYVQS